MVVVSLYVYIIVKRKNFWQKYTEKGPVGVFVNDFVTGWVPGG